MSTKGRVKEKLEIQPVGVIKAPAQKDISILSMSMDTATMIHHDVDVYDRKGVEGRKRHIKVNSLGIPPAIVVTATNVSGSQGLCLLLKRVQNLDLNLECLYLLYVDGGYRGLKLAQWVM